MGNKFFEELKESLGEALEHAQGKKNDLRTTVLPAPPAEMQQTEIVELREKLRCSQAVFARALNVSVKTVQAWEQGARRPSDAALKLLSIAQKHPQILFE